MKVLISAWTLRFSSSGEIAYFQDVQDVLKGSQKQSSFFDCRGILEVKSYFVDSLDQIHFLHNPWIKVIMLSLTACLLVNFIVLQLCFSINVASFEASGASQQFLTVGKILFVFEGKGTHSVASDEEG